MSGRYPSEGFESDAFASVLEVAWSVLADPSEVEVLDSPSFPAPLREPRP